MGAAVLERGILQPARQSSPFHSLFSYFSPHTRHNHFHTLNIDARIANTKRPHELLPCQHACRSHAFRKA